VSFINAVENDARYKGNGGIPIFVDMESRYHFGEIDDVVSHELSLPSRYHNMKIKRLCIYHEKDFDRLREEQKQSLREYHGKELLITELS
jgi:myo-inositol catabolism protein IolC